MPASSLLLGSAWSLPWTASPRTTSMTEKQLIWNLATKDLAHILSLIEASEESFDSYNDIANAMRGAARRFDSLAELEKEGVLR